MSDYRKMTVPENHIVLSNGYCFNPSEPDPRLITIEAIAQGLCCESRFNGQNGSLYSVAQHSVLCVILARYNNTTSTPIGANLLLAILLHDASEGLGLKDIPSPVKKMLPDYKKLESKTQKSVWQWADLEEDMFSPVKLHYLHRIDKMMFRIEGEKFFPDSDYSAYPEAKKKVTIERWTPERAYAEFIHMYEYLMVLKEDPSAWYKPLGWDQRTGRTTTMLLKAIFSARKEGERRYVVGKDLHHARYLMDECISILDDLGMSHDPRRATNLVLFGPSMGIEFSSQKELSRCLQETGVSPTSNEVYYDHHCFE